MKYGWYYTQVASRGAQNKSLRDTGPEGKTNLENRRSDSTDNPEISNKSDGQDTREEPDDKLACRQDSSSGSGTDMTRSVYGRPRTRNAQRSESGRKTKVNFLKVRKYKQTVNG